MVTGSLIAGKVEVGLIVWTPAPGMTKTIVSSTPALAWAARIACRSVPAPLSLVFSTVKVAGSQRFSNSSRYGWNGSDQARSGLVRAALRALVTRLRSQAKGMGLLSVRKTGTCGVGYGGDPFVGKAPRMRDGDGARGCRPRLSPCQQACAGTGWRAISSPRRTKTTGT